MPVIQSFGLIVRLGSWNSELNLMWLVDVVVSFCRVLNTLKIPFDLHDALDLWSLDLERLNFIGLFLALIYISNALSKF